MERAYIAGRTPIKVDVKKGETYAWCSCGASNGQPFCDGSHKGTKFKPNVWKCEEDASIHMCACKLTTDEKGKCNGFHKRIKDA